eukprot:351466-Heterocapsa_arctica.AAC.1
MRGIATSSSRVPAHLEVVQHRVVDVHAERLIVRYLLDVRDSVITTSRCGSRAARALAPQTP